MRVGLLAGVMVAYGLTGCTPFHQTSYPSGVSATQVDANTMRIVGKGNDFTPAKTIDDFVQLKAAEETIAHGYDIFEIVQSGENAHADRIELSLNFSTPATTYDETLLIKMYKNPKPEGDSHNYYDARQVQRDLAWTTKK